MAIHYTQEQRESILRTLTESQQMALLKVRRYEVQSAFLNADFAAETDWEFVDYRFGTGYGIPDHPKEARLYCECGRELRHQYILRSKSTKELKMLGSKHLSDHLGVPLEVAKRVVCGMQKIDVALDEILFRIKRGDPFPQAAYEQVLQRTKSIELTKKMAYLADFAAVGLPIFFEDEERLKQASSTLPNKVGSGVAGQALGKTANSSGKSGLTEFWDSIKGEVQHSGYRSRSSRYQRPVRLYETPDLAKIISKLTAYELGDQLDLAELAVVLDRYLPVASRPYGATTETILQAMLAELASGRQEVTVLQRGDSYFRIG